MQSTDLIEHVRLLSEVASALTALRADVDRIRRGEIAKPVREIVPVSLHVQELALRCTRQLHDLSISQYATMKRGEQNLAHLVGACSQISLAATLCNLAIYHRTEVLLYDDADPTPAASRDQLRRASDEMQRAAVTYRALAFRLSRRLASSAAPRQGPRTMPDDSTVTLPEPASTAVAHARR
ncbi:hypothetical protein OIC43_09560 [Streptomyces sp. NBC_00825]|uniref:hypothetical protein n=1 Tax=unclassified Streptomyces TaxID=2593676 RepID=UPI002ED295DD|nr:hypothetical protein OG832_34135 [Streptomyces sp. NBC_00826]WTH89268.1 hypothetical protein OIC43_09560 [Streptomyces sp. NBC_00825]WTH97993.1 hypothetical protein OHA23_09545 [Streptomyces sp. NBC_00822]